MLPRQNYASSPDLVRLNTAQIQAMLELSRRCLWETVKAGDAMLNSANTRHYLRARMRGFEREVFVCLFLTSQHQVIACEELFHGTIDEANVYPREVLKRCLHHNAAAIILAHNHPSGQVEPSQADLRITQRLDQALALVDVRVLDHFVVTDNEVVSFAERGLMAAV